MINFADLVWIGAARKILSVLTASSFLMDQVVRTNGERHVRGSQLRRSSARRVPSPAVHGPLAIGFLSVLFPYSPLTVSNNYIFLHI
jgi:hypothetical protein